MGARWHHNHRCLSSPSPSRWTSALTLLAMLLLLLAVPSSTGHAVASDPAGGVADAAGATPPVKPEPAEEGPAAVEDISASTQTIPMPTEEVVEILAKPTPNTPPPKPSKPAARPTRSATETGDMSQHPPRRPTKPAPTAPPRTVAPRPKSSTNEEERSAPIAISIRADGACTVDGGYTGTLTLRAARPVVLADVLVVPRADEVPVLPGLASPLPLSASPTARLTWRLPPDTRGLAPTAILARIDGIQGQEAANQLAGNGQQGWFLARLRPRPPCAAHPLSEVTPTPVEADGQRSNRAPTEEAAPRRDLVTPSDASFSATGLTGYSASIADLTLPAVTYSHIDQATVGTLTLTAEDNQADPGAGWHVTVLSSDFVYSGPYPGTAIPATNFRLTSAATPIAINGQAVDPVHGPTVPSDLAFPASLETPRTVLRADAGYGQGTYTQALDVALTVPAMSLAGTYTATLTVTITAGP